MGQCAQMANGGRFLAEIEECDKSSTFRQQGSIPPIHPDFAVVPSPLSHLSVCPELEPS